MGEMYENKTILTKEDYLKFYRFSYFRINKMKIVIFNVVFIIIALVGIKTLEKQIALGTSQIVISCIALAYVNSFPFVFGNGIWNKIKDRKDCLENVITFHSDCMIIKNNKGRKKVKYDEMFKAVETNKYIYLFQNKNQANILRKDCFRVGDMAKCVELIKTQLNKKFDEYK